MNVDSRQNCVTGQACHAQWVLDLLFSLYAGAIAEAAAFPGRKLSQWGGWGGWGGGGAAAASSAAAAASDGGWNPWDGGGAAAATGVHQLLNVPCSQ